MDCNGVDWIQDAQDKIQCMSFLKTGVKDLYVVRAVSCSAERLSSF